MEKLPHPEKVPDTDDAGPPVVLVSRTPWLRLQIAYRLWSNATSGNWYQRGRQLRAMLAVAAKPPTPPSR
jgi:hypothetical protein